MLLRVLGLGQSGRGLIRSHGNDHLGDWRGITAHAPPGGDVTERSHRLGHAHSDQRLIGLVKTTTCVSHDYFNQRKGKVQNGEHTTKKMNKRTTFLFSYYTCNCSITGTSASHHSISANTKPPIKKKKP